jgi:hypothetical protein
MFHRAIASAIVAAIVSFAAISAFAQSPSAKPKYPAEIAAANKRLAEKQENCRREAKQQKLSYLKRRRFIRGCMKR